jgi:hypothetical protein
LTLATRNGLLNLGRPSGKLATPVVQEVLDELVPLALEIPDRAERSRRLFLKLRKSMGSPRFDGLMHGIVSLAQQDHPAGARLLASFLDTATFEERVVPPLCRLSSSRRIHQILEQDQRKANAFSRDWLLRLNKLTDLVENLPQEKSPSGAAVPVRPGSEYPWSILRRALADAVAVARDEESPDPRITMLIQNMLRLEVDALEERASRLAGIIDPFRITAVQRLLPILGALDPRIRDTRLFIASLNDGDLDATFHRQRPRALEVMDDSEYRALLECLAELEFARPLVNLLRNRVDHPRPIPLLAAGVARLRHLGDILSAAGLQSSCDNLLGAAELASRCDSARGLEIPLTVDEVDRVADILGDPEHVEPSLPTPVLEGDVLLLPWPNRRETARAWPHEFPADELVAPLSAAEPRTVAESVEEENPEPGRKDDLCTTEIKKLVMNSLQTTSVLLAYLRNAKVTSIPGLVTEIANRTRNPQIITTIAGDRSLYSGFANRDVPLACLRNPSNVSVKILRKFVHVKFVSKMDLKLMALDKAGVRRELRREIEHYLESLS